MTTIPAHWQVKHSWGACVNVKDQNGNVVPCPICAKEKTVTKAA